MTDKNPNLRVSDLLAKTAGVSKVSIGRTIVAMHALCLYTNTDMKDLASDALAELFAAFRPSSDNVAAANLAHQDMLDKARKTRNADGLLQTVLSNLDKFKEDSRYVDRGYRDRSHRDQRSDHGGE